MATAEPEGGFAVVAFREDGAWQVGMLPERLVNSLDGLIHALRQQPGEGGSIGLVNVDDEFFVALRVRGESVQLLLSDVAAAADWELAGEVLARLGVPKPAPEDLEDLFPAGDLSIFADLGVDELDLTTVVSDEDAYADEMLSIIAGKLGFAEAFERALDAAVT